MFPFIQLVRTLNRKKNEYKRLHGHTRGPYCLFFIDHRNKLIYVENPKAASRSILASMGTAHISDTRIVCSIPKPHIAIALPSYKSWTPHLFVFSKWRLSHETRDYVTPREIKEYFFFTFVRNPFDRLVSGYTNKIISDTPIPFPPHIPMTSWRELLGITPTDNPHDPAMLARFVERYLTTTNISRLDVHFQPQHTLIEDHLPRKLDFIGHIETFEQDWQLLTKRFNLPNHTVTHINKSSIRYPYHAYFAHPHEVEQVYKYYKEDIGRYGYQHVYETLLSTCMANTDTHHA